MPRLDSKKTCVTRVLKIALHEPEVKHDDVKDRKRKCCLLRRICKRSDQPKIEIIADNDARLILRKKA